MGWWFGRKAAPDARPFVPAWLQSDATEVGFARSFHEQFEEVHEYLAYIALALIALHVAGALKHHFDGHRHLIGRMAPWAWRGQPRP